MPRDRGPQYVPLAEAYKQYGRGPVDRLRHAGHDGTPAVLTEATWEGDPTIYLLASELRDSFEKPTLTRGGQQVS